MSLLECRDLQKIYPGGKHAVKNASFHVERGEIVGLLGPNGAGKSTTFSMACGLVAPTAGSVFLNEKDVTYEPMYKRAQMGLGYLAQDDSIFVKLSVEQNIAAILEFLKLKPAERKRFTTELLEQFSLTDRRYQVASTLSGGERRRLEIARCLASKPDIILLDEPFTGIDPVTINDIQDIVARLRDQGISILLTDHRERETLTITDRSYIFCDGEIICDGDAETVLNDPLAKAKYFGSRFDAGSIIEGKSAFDAPGHAEPESGPMPQPVGLGLHEPGEVDVDR